MMFWMFGLPQVETAKEKVRLKEKCFKVLLLYHFLEVVTASTAVVKQHSIYWPLDYLDIEKRDMKKVFHNIFPHHRHIC